jgi:hypothetical protein
MIAGAAAANIFFVAFAIEQNTFWIFTGVFQGHRQI